jgi:hypothetical protein
MEIRVFNDMNFFYKYFNRNFASIMAPITKLLTKSEIFEWTKEGVLYRFGQDNKFHYVLQLE